jgi:hypothetical protein
MASNRETATKYFDSCPHADLYHEDGEDVSDCDHCYECPECGASELAGETHCDDCSERAIEDDEADQPLAAQLTAMLDAEQRSLADDDAKRGYSLK